jgi:thiamine-phosphate pyrophosphorylase
LSKNGLLYLILDTEVIKTAGLDILSLAEKLSLGGVDVFQLRTKTMNDQAVLQLAKKLAKIIQSLKRTFIVNDRVDIACLSGADGLHLGKDDIPVSSARKILGKKAIIGKTVHSMDELGSFQKEDLDYLSIGPVFSTKTKPDLGALKTSELKPLFREPKQLTFAIGGINLYNINLLFDQGIKNIAVCRGIISAENPKRAVQDFKECLKKAS